MTDKPVSKHGGGIVWRLALLLAAASSAALLAQAPAPNPSGRSQDGIKVRGHWTIDVKNADGSLVSRHEFDNALVTGQNGGDFVLAGLLGRTVARVASWTVILSREPVPPGGWSSNGPCLLTDDILAYCEIREGPDPGVVAGLFGGLIVSTPSGPNHTLVLSGSATIHPGRVPPTVSRSIGAVSTRLDVCLTQDCSDSRSLPFSARALPSPVPVLPTQVVQVTVVFSFS
jgi:hypothetical protein